jgi:hypothetical protein
LKDWEGGIVCSTSHARTFMRYGIEPTHIVALDPFCNWGEIDGVDWSKTRTKLCMHPGVMPDLVENWPNDILLFRQDMGTTDDFYSTTQMHMYTDREGDRSTQWDFKVAIRTTVTLFANSPPAQLFLAYRLGYGTCFLAGCDYAYPNGVARFNEYVIRAPAQELQLGNAPTAEIEIDWEEAKARDRDIIMDGIREQDEIVMTANGIPTAQINIFYKKNMISAIRLSKRMVVTTDHGAITEFPYMPAAKVIATQGKRVKIWNEKRLFKVTERYLAATGAYVITDRHGGCNFIESQNPELELNNFMVKMRQQCVCPVCGLSAINETGKGPASEKCPRCQQSQFTHKHDIDIPGNMKRIYGLLEWARKEHPQTAPDDSKAPHVHDVPMKS